MGRRKVNEAPSVGNQKKLIKAFNKKKSFIFKKTFELSTLCDIPACVIIYGPNADEPASVWPEEPQAFNHVLTRYINTSSEEKRNNKRGLGLPNKELQQEQVLDVDNAKQFEKLPNTGFPGNDWINKLSNEQRLGFVNQLNSKLHIVNSRIDKMKREKLESEQLYNANAAAAAEEQQKMIAYNMQTIQSLQQYHQYQCQPDYLRYLDEQRQQTEMNQMIGTLKQDGFYNNNNNVNVGDYNGFIGFPMCDQTPMACYDPRIPLQAHLHQPYMSNLPK